MKLAGISTLLAVPLVLGAIISEQETANDSSLFSLLKRFQSLSVDGYKQEISRFMTNAQRIADDALAEYGQENKIDNWPNNLYELSEMMINKADVNVAGLFNVSLPSFPFGVDNKSGTVKPTSASGAAFTLGNTIFSFAGPTAVPRAPTVYTIGGTVYSVAAPTSTPSGGVSIDIPNFFSGLLNPAPSASPKQSLVNSKPFDPKVTDSASIHKLCTAGGLGGLAACIAEGFANALDGFNNQLFNLLPFTDFIRFIGNAIGQFLQGTFNIDKIVNGFVGLFSSIISGDNPIGFIVRGIATSIYNNPAAPIAGFVNAAQFVTKLSHDIIAFFERGVGELSEGTKDIISQVVNGVVDKVVELVHNNPNPGKPLKASAVAFPVLAREFFKFTDTRTAMVSTDLQKIMKFAQHVGNTAYASDPSLYTVLVNPSEENIRKTVVLVAKIVADYNS